MSFRWRSARSLTAHARAHGAFPARPAVALPAHGLQRDRRHARARVRQQASKLGAYLNELTDVVSDAALYLPFAFLPGSSLLLVGAIIALSIVSEYAGVLGATVGASRRYDGPMGKSDRAFVFGLLGLLVGLGFGPGMVKRCLWIWAIVLVLLAVTIVNRVRAGLAEPVTHESHEPA